jgi:hypothetical protein
MKKIMKEMSTQPVFAIELDGGEVVTVEELLKECVNIIREQRVWLAMLEAQVTPRPIEEAPKDQRVLVFCPEESDYGYTAAWVIGECVLDSWEGDSRLDDGVQPTYWLPMPPDWIEVTDPTEVTK